MVFGFGRTATMVTPQEALPGRPDPLPDIPDTNVVLGTSMHPPFPEGSATLYVAMGCFWGAERIFWRLPGVITTAVGYMGGYTPNPTYEETCTGRTGHTETAMVVYDPQQISAGEVLKAFWENHDPTTANRQGNDVGTQYRSAVYWTTPEQEAAVAQTTKDFQKVLYDNGFGAISTEEKPASEVGPFYYAEGYHQQYLHKNPGGYCNHGFKGMTCPVGLVRQDQLPAQQDILPG